MCALGLVKESRADRQAAFFHCPIKIKQGLTQFIHLPQVGQVRALAEGGQFIEQGIEFLALARVLLPAQQQRLGVEQDVHALGQEAGNQLRVALDPQALARRIEQRLQACIDHLVNIVNQHRRPGYRCQRRA
ncbi:hypothetical protein D3C80_673670 [compost metagenome]